MSDAVRFPLVLGIITLCSAAGLAITYSATRRQIEFQQRLARDRALAEALRLDIEPQELQDPEAPRPWEAFHYSGAGDGKAAQGFAVYQATDPRTGQRLYAAQGEAQGYQSRIKVVAAVDQSVEKGLQEATIQAIKVVSQAETPGLGNHCVDAWFQAQFRGLPVPMLEVDKTAQRRRPGAEGSDQQPVAAITGATITSKAVAAATRQALQRIRRHVQSQKKSKQAPNM
ncbi:MAG: FMN-binding protein [Candidatus Brocadiia bacterium]